MLGNAKECRQRAARCAEMAIAAHTPQLRGKFLELSKNWEKLAIQLENAFAQLAESEDVSERVQETVNDARPLWKNSPIRYTTFDRSAHRAPHGSCSFLATLRGQLASGSHSNSFASIP